MSYSLADWLPALPKAWQLKPFYSLFSEKVQPNTGLHVENVLSLSYGRIVERDVESNHGLLPASFEGYNIVEPNDIVLRLTDLQNDQRSLRSGQVTERGVITSAYVTVTPNQSLHPRFAHYLLHGYDLAKLFYRMGGGLRQSMKYDDLKRMPVVLPPLCEQERIANFLDQQTARIDALIAEKERLNEKLGEYLQSSIYSVIEDFIKASSQPKRLRLRAVYEISMGQTILAADLTEEGLPVYSATAEDIYFGRLASPSLVLHPGDIVVAARGNSIGNPKLVREDCTCTQTTIAMRRKSEVLLPAYTRYWMLANREEVFWFDRTAIPQLTTARLGDFRIPILSLIEQQDAVEKLDARCAQVQELFSHTEEHIERLREYRSSLISAAVTGQLDLSTFKAAA